MSDAEQTEAERRRHKLDEELEAERSTSHTAASSIEGRISKLFWLQLTAGGAASLIGLTRFEWVQPWIVSVIAGIATACVVVVRETKWRAKADWHYARRDIAAGLLNRLRYEMPDPITKDSVAAISKDFRQQRDMLGLRMKTINADSEENNEQTK